MEEEHSSTPHSLTEPYHNHSYDIEDPGYFCWSSGGEDEELEPDEPLEEGNDEETTAYIPMVMQEQELDQESETDPLIRCRNYAVPNSTG